MTTFPAWLALREPADAAARSRDLVDALRPLLTGPLVVHDLGCGSGSMGRWLAPLLPVPPAQQTWVLHDRDPELLAIAAEDAPPGALVETRAGDVTALAPDALSGAGLVTSSALLDILTAEELAGFVAACASSGAPVLVTLDVTGEVALDPSDPLDSALRDAFNAHQRRPVRGGDLLGPDAPSAVAAAFRARGQDVRTAASPWRLDAATGELLLAWLEGWVAAAVEQRPDLAAPAAAWAARRVAQVESGSLAVTVQHEDLLAAPRR
ncbi:class I SAM-dependent methyltransferase [Nocardioides iriomotensis]|uniref:Class I SAM-dependent methyltransferase n=1 Tax=Nocardioides iriomotensis TaxID=715784 RepID=A0A4Q5IVB7_9ACTN|nr:class I SAM-dependent methyltransferase [Nocardioides iriomotensis]RYU09947.1 class I SAM-dependent methyltransferase [Nocardioides iriomotensis]